VKGEIIAIRQVLNDDLSINCYEVIVDTLNKPDLRLGKCKIIQNGEEI